MHFSTLLRALALVTVVPRIAALPQGVESELGAADATEWDEEEPTTLEESVGDAALTEASYDKEEDSAWPTSTDEEDAAPTMAVETVNTAEPTAMPEEWEEENEDEGEVAVEDEAVPEDGDFEDTSFNATSVSEAEDPFIGLGMWPEPWEPECYSDADRAKWKWRNACDRNKQQKLHSVCWTRAPNREMCCKPKINHEDLVLNPDGGKSAFVREGSCGQWWPHRAYERFVCAENCKIDDLRGRVTSRSCKFMNGGKDFKINNPEDICRCMTKHCR